MEPSNELSQSDLRGRNGHQPGALDADVTSDITKI